MLRKTSPRASWCQIAHDYWEKLVGEIFVPGMLKNSSGDLFQRGDRVSGIWIIELLESRDVVLEFFMSSASLYVSFKHNGLPTILVRSLFRSRDC